MIIRDINIKSAMKNKQKGFLLNPFRFGSQAPATFPELISVTEYSDTNGGTYSFPAPASRQVGDLLLLCHTSTNSSTTVNSPYTTLYSLINGGGISGSLAGWKIADGTSADDATGSNGGGLLVLGFIAVIRGANAIQHSRISAASATLNPPSLTITGGLKKALWVTVCGGRLPNTLLNTTPLNYTNLAQQNVLSGNRYGIARGFRQLEASTEDPSAFVADTTVNGFASTFAIWQD